MTTRRPLRSSPLALRYGGDDRLPHTDHHGGQEFAGDLGSSSGLAGSPLLVRWGGVTLQ